MNSVRDIIKYYRPAVVLDRALPRGVREKFHVILPTLVVIVFGLFAWSGFENLRFYGLFLILIALWIFSLMVHAFFNSFRFEGLETVVDEHVHSSSLHRASYEVADLLWRSDGDLIHGLLSSPMGVEVLVRAGINAENVSDFQEHADKVPLDVLGGKKVRLRDILAALLSESEVFKQFIFKQGVQEDDLLETASWVERIYHTRKIDERWWGRDQLGRIPSIGTDWSYGKAFTLEKYGSYMEATPYFSSASPSEEEVEEEVRAIESVLARKAEANALMIGKSSEEMMQVVGRVAYHIAYGSILPALKHKRMFVLDGRALVASLGKKAAVERELIQAFNQAVKAGNLIIVIKDLPGFLESADALDVDVLGILDPFLTSADLQVVALARSGEFYGALEHQSNVVERFEVIEQKGSERDELIVQLSGIVPIYEAQSGLFFTYQALEAVADNARRYFTSGILADKVHDLMEELVPYAQSRGEHIVGANTVDSLVHSKTGIPTGEVSEDEKDLLLNLEERLHERVIGQDAAIESIAKALRRARSGVRSDKRPMGSFLFLGPTGVGKTETAKNLARVFFGGDDKMVRFDMSEYRGEDALEKLIGSFESEKAGMLVKKLRQDPYAVILLDEFEKTDEEVKDLFLQVLDEGVFNDMAGREVFARDALFIATSNAASDVIWEYFDHGKNPIDHTEELIDTIVSEGIFKPELLNRFDGIVVFHPLEEEHLEKIAHIMLKELQERLYQQGIDFVITDELVSYVAEEGYNPQFGARPMNRVIQDKVEQAVAVKKLQGEVKEGSRVKLQVSDLSDVDSETTSSQD